MQIISIPRAVTSISVWSILGDPGAVSRAWLKGATKVFKHVLENFRRAFSPGPTDCPWASEDGCGGTETFRCWQAFLGKTQLKTDES